MRRRTFVHAVGAVGAAASMAGRAAFAQTLAGAQIRMVVPFPPGGPTDIVARPLAQLLGDAMKATIVVDNRGGAGGSVGASIVAKSPPDGKTILMGTVGTHAINAALYKSPTYDAEKEFTPIALVAMAPVTIVVNVDSPVKTLAELVASARQEPGKLTYGSAGSGTPGHLTGEMFKRAAGIDMLHVPYKGSAPAVTDLLGGQLKLMFDPLQSVLSHVQAGKLRAIALSSKARASVLPDVPTIAVSGYPGFETTAWWGVFAPAGVAASIADALAADIERVVKGAEFRGKLESLGVVPLALTRAAVGDFQRAELAKWGQAVRESGARVD
jgi:tripartite-type tricarboxylate transporter receptor subunit TctC